MPSRRRCGVSAALNDVGGVERRRRRLTFVPAAFSHAQVASTVRRTSSRRHGVCASDTRAWPISRCRSNMVGATFIGAGLPIWSHVEDGGRGACPTPSSKAWCTCSAQRRTPQASINHTSQSGRERSSGMPPDTGQLHSPDAARPWHGDVAQVLSRSKSGPRSRWVIQTGGTSTSRRRNGGRDRVAVRRDRETVSEAVGGRRRIENHEVRHVHERRRRLHVQEARVETGKSLHGAPFLFLACSHGNAAESPGQNTISMTSPRASRVPSPRCSAVPCTNLVAVAVSTTASSRSSLAAPARRARLTARHVGDELFSIALPAGVCFEGRSMPARTLKANSGWASTICSWRSGVSAHPRRDLREQMEGLLRETLAIKRSFGAQRRWVIALVEQGAAVPGTRWIDELPTACGHRRRIGGTRPREARSACRRRWPRPPGAAARQPPNVAITSRSTVRPWAMATTQPPRQPSTPATRIRSGVAQTEHGQTRFEVLDGDVVATYSLERGATHLEGQLGLGRERDDRVAVGLVAERPGDTE